MSANTKPRMSLPYFIVIHSQIDAQHCAGPAAGAQGAASKPSETSKAPAGSDVFENAF